MRSPGYVNMINWVSEIWYNIDEEIVDDNEPNYDEVVLDDDDLFEEQMVPTITKCKYFDTKQ
jgi:hypothetical protein